MHWMTSLDVDGEYEKLIIRMNPPRVSIDNIACENATLVKVDSANKHGILLEVVQVLTDLHLTISKAYISSDGGWFMDVFHVIDKDGKKVRDEQVIEYIQQSLGTNACLLPSMRRSVGVKAAAEHTAIELTARDRPGLLSEVFAVLTDLNCNVVAAEVWTHNTRVAAVVYFTDELTGAPIDDSERLSKIKLQLCCVLKGDNDKRGAKTAVSMVISHTERRLHQMMFADRDYERAHNGGAEPRSDQLRPVVTLQNCVEKGYSVVNVKCKDRPKLLFDTVCTLTDMQYVVFHGTVDAEGPDAYQVYILTHHFERLHFHKYYTVLPLFLFTLVIGLYASVFWMCINGPDAYQEYYIRYIDGCPVNSEAERRRIIHCLEAAIERRVPEGLRLELCSGDRVGLLSDVTRIFRENGLSVTGAEVSTRGDKALNVFYVTDAAGNPVNAKTIEAVGSEIGQTILQVKESSIYSKSPPEETGGKFSLGNLFRSSSERFLHNLGFIKSPS